MRVFLLGLGNGKYPSFLYQCKKAFETLGHETRCFNYRPLGLHKFGLTNKFLNQLILSKITKYNPDLLLVTKGETLSPGLIETISKNKIKTVNWSLDDPFGKLYPENRIKNIQEYDYFFVFDPYYVSELRETNPHSYYLPCSSDPKHIHTEVIPYDKREYNTDLSFIGSYEPERQKLFEKLKKYDLNIWGPGWKTAKGVLGDHIHQKILRGKSMCKQFNLSKINLNIQALHGIESMNMRTFEVPATKSLQLCDFRKELPRLFRLNKEIICYKNFKEFKEKIDYYLRKENKDEIRKIINAGHRRVTKEHTTKHRIEKLLQIVK